LRIARDMHDSLGHRLSLVSIQAAALEVTDLPPDQQRAIRALADSTRDAVGELHDLVGALRSQEDESPGLAQIDTAVAEFRAAGMQVTLQRRGEPTALPAEPPTGSSRKA
jgi:signal transduction histidine kinase